MTSIRRTPAMSPMQAQDLDWLLEQWLAWCYRQVDTEQTAPGYAYKLAYFRNWWADVGPTQAWLLHRDDLERYECHLREGVTGKWTQKPLSYHSRNDALRRLRQAFAWAWNKGYTDRDYSQWVPAAHGGPEQRRSVPLIVLRKLMRAAGTTAHPARDRAILAVLIGMGLRRLECVNLNVQDIVVEADGSGYGRKS